MNTIRLILEYDGTRYSGWQEQRNATTVQGVLRKAVEETLGERVELSGAGRTDAGVHALGQVAHVRLRGNVPPFQKIYYGVNDRLPADVNLLAVEPVPPRFHARHDAVLRSYVYQISTRRTAFAKKYVWWVKDALDEEAMARAASAFAGRHDFTSFSQQGDPSVSSVVKVEESRLEPAGDLLLYRIAASHFLWKMVRRVVGALVAVGRGEMTAADLERLLERPSGEVAALTAPPSGLFLEQVLYSRAEPRRPLAPAFPVS